MTCNRGPIFGKLVVHDRSWRDESGKLEAETREMDSALALIRQNGLRFHNVVPWRLPQDLDRVPPRSTKLPVRQSTVSTGRSGVFGSAAQF